MILLLLALVSPAHADDVNVYKGKPYGGIFTHGTITLNEVGIRTETHVLFAVHTDSYSYADIREVTADLGLFRGWVVMSMTDKTETSFNMPRHSARELEATLTRRIMTAK